MRSRAIAAFTAAWLLVCGVLAGRHEATVAHVSDGAGGYAHGKVLAGQHAGQQSDIHGQRNPETDAGDCALLAAFHQAASAGVTAPALVTAACLPVAHGAPRAAAIAATAERYRLAPKTSPPRSA